MDRDPSYWPEAYPGPCNSMGTDHYIESEGSGEYVMQYPSVTDLANIVLAYPPVAAISSDICLAGSTPYFTQCGTSTGLRHPPAQQLHIDTQLASFQVGRDVESSTTSSSSLPKGLRTPYFTPHTGFPLSIRIPSPQSAPADGRMVLPDSGELLENKACHPASPMSHYSSNFDGNMSDSPEESGVVTQLPMPHIVEWKKVIERCGTNDFVPQTVYQPFTEADRKRYIRDVELQETIFFQSDGSPDPGISLDDALKQRLKNLLNKDDLMFVGCGPSVSIRIQWPGYSAWSKQIPTMDFKNPKGPITRAKLAKNIATCIRRFSEVVQDKPMEAESDPKWKIGNRHIKVEDLILVSLHHVSKGSWQPQLRLRTLPFQWSSSLPSFVVS